PLLLLLEDVHWADDLSFELLNAALEQLSGFRFYVLLLSRPHGLTQNKRLDLAEASSARYLEMQLSELTGEETHALITAMLPGLTIEPALMEEINAWARGNPFFIEELTKALVQDGSIREVKGQWVVASDVNLNHVPDSIHGLLAARIDMLDGDIKRTIQHAAIIGRNFWQSLLSHLLQLDSEPALRELSALGFVEEYGGSSPIQDIEWAFRHVLVQEVAYGSVLKETRGEAHRQIARWMETQAADLRNELASTLARHFEGGHLWEKAVYYYSLAGSRSRSLFALKEAAGFLENALRITEAHGESFSGHERIAVLKNLGVVQGLAGQFEGSIARLSEVLKSARALHDQALEQEMLTQIGMVYRRADDYPHAKEFLIRALDKAREVGDDLILADVLYHLGSVFWSEGRNIDAQQYHMEAVGICNRLNDKGLAAVQAYHGLGEVYWFAARPQSALEYFRKSLEISKGIGDKSYESENLQMIGMLQSNIYGIGQPQLGVKNSEEAYRIAQDAYLDWHKIPALNTIAINFLGLGEYERAYETFKSIVPVMEKLDLRRFNIVNSDYFGYFYLELNMFEKAEKLFARGISTSQELGTDFFLPRLKANLLISKLRQGALDIQTELSEILNESRERGQFALGLRALEGLAELMIARQDGKAGLPFAQELFHWARQEGMAYLHAQASLLLADLHLLQNELAASQAKIEMAKAIADQQTNPRLQWELAAAFARLAEAMEAWDEMALHRQRANEIAARIAQSITSPDLRFNYTPFEVDR
ncbi:MAG: tetratricopeptide repeat protein, partial [Anaerolineales bacterium]|nr:tetratricopeptide repeat protein [Anaerolineales bacterium]